MEDCQCQMDVSWKSFDMKNIANIPYIIGYKISPTHLKIMIDDDFIIEKTIILIFNERPDIESYTWINKHSVRDYTDIWIAYGRYFHRKNTGDDLWIINNMFDICKHCYGSDDFTTDDILKYYLNYRSRRFPVYNPPSSLSKTDYKKL